MSVNVRADKKDRKLRSKQRGECCCVFLSPGRVILFLVFFVEKDWKQKKLSLDSEKHRTAFTPLFASQLPVNLQSTCRI